MNQIDQVENKVTSLRGRLEELQTILRAHECAAAFCTNGLGPEAEPLNWELVFRNLSRSLNEFPTEFECVENLLIEIRSNQMSSQQSPAVTKMV